LTEIFQVLLLTGTDICDLETTDKSVARRKLVEFRRKLGQVDASAGKIPGQFK
jgi:hypothetical protein